MIHSMRLRKHSFILIKEGKKTVDIRLFDEKRQHIKRGDQIEYSSVGDPSQKVRVEILDLHRFESFEKLFSAFDCESLGVDKKEDLSYIHDIYSKEEEKAYGVVGIEIRLIPE